MDKKTKKKIGLQICEHNDSPCSFCQMKVDAIEAITEAGYIQGEIQILSPQERASIIHKYNYSITGEVHKMAKEIAQAQVDKIKR